MGKTNLQAAVEKVQENFQLWHFLGEIIKYYMNLRSYKAEDLAADLGYKNKSSMANLHRGIFTPGQIERIIDVLKIEDMDANRIRAKYWNALCGGSDKKCEFNKLYSPEAESIIRELTFENDKLKKQIDVYRLHADISADVCANHSASQVKKKP